MSSSFAEITDVVDLCLSDGNLNPNARGYTRRPLHRTNLAGWGRNKRWEYWGIVTPRYVLGMTISSLDYASVNQFYLLDRETGKEVEIASTVPLGRKVTLPDTLPPFTARATTKKVVLSFADTAEATTIRASVAGIDVDLRAEAGEDSLGVVVPWSSRLFQYTLKDLARVVTGSITVDGVRYDLPAKQSWAVLDRGRGRWPYSATWNWGAGSGIVKRKKVGLQLGGGWTVGTGSTENALFVDGHLDYIPNELGWTFDGNDFMQPWTVVGDRVNVTLTPFHVRNATTNALIVSGETHQAFGEWTGWVRRSSGKEISVDGLVGWAEVAANRW
ncbi:DUF2804 domain-containing protein [Lysinibacter cavernae]|uniref:Uncharacterized protein YaiE (UPF0345 family) n=1 Tax=Lysinibacter cavernae TaxID=1640652 RepID=A0A7X5TUN7_9MICO|nr:DUF2804 domain-containing protein [Lysinibacter cavernae]NIH54578.1 uncharacterized protein YaiE (UPF0345 family) [Lysinibacter cavernae]